MQLLNIIIPHHNTPGLLQRCIDSIPEMEEIQVYVVDDNSNPDLVNFSEFPGKDRKNVHIYLTKDGKGAGYARNVGLLQAKGDWLLFADSDDFFVPDFYKIVSKFFDSDADMILFKANSVNSDTLEPSNRNKNINNRIDECLNGLLTAKEASISVQSPWCRLIKRDFVEKYHIRFDEVMSCNDTMFTTKATCFAEKVLVCDQVVYVVTHRTGSLWDSRKIDPKNYLTRIKVQIRRNKFVSKYGFKKEPIIGHVYRALDISFTTFLKALWLAIKEFGLFHGFSFYLKRYGLK